MAKSKYKHTKITTDKIQVEGILNTEDMTVEVDDIVVSIADELADYNGKFISLTFVEKTEEDVDGNNE